MSLRDTRPALRREHGFTVMELLVSLVILGVAFAVFSMVISTTVRDSGEVREDAVLQGEVRAAVDRLARDLRQAYTGDTTSPLETMTATQITFLSPDRATPFHNRRISYRLVTGKLERAQAISSNTNGPPWTIPALGSYVQELGSVTSTTAFSYYDLTGAVATTPGDVDSVTVTIKVATNTNKTREFTYTTSIALRTNQ